MPTFISKSLGLRLVRQSQIDMPLPNGHWHMVQKPVRYEFGPNGRIDVAEGADVLRDGPPETDPETGEIKRNPETGIPVLTLQDGVTWLRNHRLYNKGGGAKGGFVELGREPGRIPDAGPRVREIMAAAFQLDRDLLEEYAAEEAAAEYSREAVDQALEEAFANVDAALEAEGGGTPGNASDEGQGNDELDSIDSMEDLKAIGAELGLEFRPGTSKVNARRAIREAAAQRASQELAGA